jgi:hypothetical protein
MDNPHKMKSLFWPILLVGVGVTWLLVNLGIIPAFNPVQLLKLWPIILIVLGFDMILGRRYPWAGSLIGLLAVAGIVTFLIMSPKLGYAPAATTKTETFIEQIGDATSSKIFLESSSAPVKVKPLSAGDELVHAVITHRSIFNFDVSGTSNRYVRMSETSDSSSWLSWDFSADRLAWDIGLAQDIPTEFILNGGSGSMDVDLTSIDLTSLRADLGSGASDFILPAVDDAYTAEIDSGSGSVKVKILDGAAMTLELSGGSGAVNVSLPKNAEFEIEIFDDGSGSLSIPPGLLKVGGGTGLSLGVWKTAGFDTADVKIIIKIMDQGSGSITIH